MAVVSFPRGDLERLVGKKLGEADIKNRIPMLGCPLEKIDKDCLYFEVSPNRPDMLSIEGFARAVRTFLGISKGIAGYKTKPSGIKLFAEPSVKTVRPYIACAVARKVRLTDDMVASLMQVQEKLHDTLGRKRKKVAIGVHDLDRVKPNFTYKAVAPDEIKFAPLDMKEKLSLNEICRKHPKGREYIHILEKSRKWPVILDKNGDVLSFPPIINGELTRVTKKTASLFIDITGTSDMAVNQALNIIATSLYDRGCEIETVEIKYPHKKITPDLKPSCIAVNLDYVNKLLDMDLTTGEFRDLLKKMGLDFDKNAIVPAYRTDIMHPIDIVEDVAIAHGYGRFEPRIPRVPTISRRLESGEFLSAVKETIIGTGFQEVATMILTNRGDEFKKMCLNESEVCETSNPVTIECAICRKTLLPSAMKVFAQNMHREFPQKIFETGDVLIPDAKEETGASVIKKLACAISNSSVSYEEISSVLDALMRNIGIDYELGRTYHPSFIKGRVAEVTVKNKPIGVIGEVSPQVLENFGLEMPVVALELDVDEIFRVVK